MDLLNFDGPFFSGSVPQAVEKANSEGRVLVVYMFDGSEDNSDMEAVFQDASVSSQLQSTVKKEGKKRMILSDLFLFPRF